MVNFVEIQKPLLHGLVKMAGLRSQVIEVEPGTEMHFWVPKRHLTNDQEKKSGGKKLPAKPSLLLIHGFAAEGIVTWQFNFGVLVTDYDLYIPDLLFFGRSTTTRPERSPDFQAECLAKALGTLGVTRCDAVGFSYGGMVAFKLAEMRPDLVRSLVVSGAVVNMTDSINEETMRRLGVGSSTELLMPENVPRLKALLSISMHRKLWFPDRFYSDYLKIMFTNRKERMELLEGVVVSNREAKIPVFQQKIFLLWGENDNIFNIDLAKKMREQLGENTWLLGVSNAGHLLHVERPCAYNRQLKRFLASVHASAAAAAQNLKTKTF